MRIITGSFLTEYIFFEIHLDKIRKSYYDYKIPDKTNGYYKKKVMRKRSTSIRPAERGIRWLEDAPENG